MPGARKYKHPGRISIWTIQKNSRPENICFLLYVKAAIPSIRNCCGNTAGKYLLRIEVMIAHILEEFPGIIE